MPPENLTIKRSVYTAACLALSVVLRLVLGPIPNVDAVFCPLHLPVLLCGYACGPLYGLLCGFLAPLLGWLVCSLPSPALLVAVTAECCVCGFLMGLLTGRRKERVGKNAYLAALLCAMLAGRIVGAVALGLVYTRGLAALMTTLTLWMLNGLPGIVLQLVILPPLVLAMEDEGLVPPSAESSSPSVSGEIASEAVDLASQKADSPENSSDEKTV